MRWIRRLDDLEGPPEPSAWIVRLDDPAAERAAAVPSAADLADAAQARAADGGAGRLWRRRLLRALGARYLAAEPAALVFAREHAGAARLVAPEPLFVSAASRGPWTVAAIGPVPLGVDVELAGGELAALAEAVGTSPAAALHGWTAAEAYVKATGCSLDLALSLEPAGGRLQAPGWAACSLSHEVVDGRALATAAWG